MWKVINLADSPDWVKKVTAFSRWLFFGTGCWGIVGWIYGVSGMCLVLKEDIFGFQGLDIGLRLLYPDFHDAYRQH